MLFYKLQGGRDLSEVSQGRIMSSEVRCSDAWQVFSLTLPLYRLYFTDMLFKGQALIKDNWHWEGL